MSLSKTISYKEYKHFIANPPEGCSVEVIDRKLWHGTIIGPPNTPYSNGKFVVKIQFSRSFPSLGPTIRMITPIFHINFVIATIGANVCIPLIYEDWDKTHHISEIMKEIRDMMIHPRDDYPQLELALLYMTNERLHNDIAAQWSVKWANGDGGGFLINGKMNHDLKYNNDSFNKNGKLGGINMLCSHIDDCNITQFKSDNYYTCVMIASGYLRRNMINPQDICSIIGQYLKKTVNKVEYINKSDHKYGMILFPSMNEICISLTKIFYGNYGCQNTNCVQDGSSQIEFGVVGIPNNNYIGNDNDSDIDNDTNVLWNIEKFYDEFTAIAIKSNENHTDSDGDANEFKDSNQNDDHLQRLPLDINLQLNNFVNTFEFKLKRKEKIECITCILTRDRSNRARDNFAQIHYTSKEDNIRYYDEGILLDYVSLKHNNKWFGKNFFDFNNGDRIILRYDKNEKSLSIDLSRMRRPIGLMSDIKREINSYVKNQQESEWVSSEGGQVHDDNFYPYPEICITKTALITQQLNKNCGIKAKNDKLYLKKGFDYVLACSICGCNKRCSTARNVYTFSNQC